MKVDPFSKTTSYINPFNGKNGNSAPLAFAVIIIASIFTLLIVQGLSSLWRYFRNGEENKIHTLGGQIFTQRVSKTPVDDLEKVKDGKVIIYNEYDVTFSWERVNEKYSAVIAEKTGLSKESSKQIVQDLFKNNEQNFVVLDKIVIEVKKEWLDKDRIKIDSFQIYGPAS